MSQNACRIKPLPAITVRRLTSRQQRIQPGSLWKRKFYETRRNPITVVRRMDNDAELRDRSDHLRRRRRRR